MKRYFILLCIACFFLNAKAQYKEKYVEDFLEVAKKIENSECQFYKDNGALKWGWLDKKTNKLNGLCYIQYNYFKSEYGFYNQDKRSGYGAYRDGRVDITGFWTDNEVDGHVLMRYYVDNDFRRHTFYQGYLTNNQPIGFTALGMKGPFEADYHIRPQSGFIREDGSFVLFKDSLVNAYVSKEQPDFVEEVVSKPFYGKNYHGGLVNGNPNGYSLFLHEPNADECNFEFGYAVNDKIRYLQAVKIEPNGYGGNYIRNLKFTYEKYELDAENYNINEFILVKPDWEKIEHSYLDGKTRDSKIFFSTEKKFHQYKTTGLSGMDGYELLNSIEMICLVLWEKGKMKEFWCMDSDGDYGHFVITRTSPTKVPVHHAIGFYINKKKVYKEAKTRIFMKPGQSQYDVFVDALGAVYTEPTTGDKIIGGARSMYDKVFKFNRTQTPPQYPDWEFWEINYGSVSDRGYDATSALQEAEKKFKIQKAARMIEEE